MREKARDLIYLDTGRYMSLDNLRVFYWGIIIIPLSMVVVSVVSINMTGVSWKSLFPIVSIGIWSLFYWIFVLIIQSKRVKKTFALRFLVNGISGLLLSSLIWMFSASFNLTADTPFLEFELHLWMILFYFLFSFAYVLAIVLCVHKGVFAVIREKSRTKTALMLSAFFGALIPCSGSAGMYASRLMRDHVSLNTQLMIITISVCLLIFMPALAHINFVQFYYCKKYGIDCDEAGNTTSPMLERKVKEEKEQIKTKEKCKKRIPFISKIVTVIMRMPMILKIIIGIVCTPIALFAAIYILFFIKAIIEEIAA